MCYEELKAFLIQFAKENGEKVIVNKKNKISVAMTLKRMGPYAKDFGAWLFNKNIMGARVVV